MKKLLLSVIATVIMSSVSVCAQGGKKKQPAKKIAKQETCNKECKDMKNCPTTCTVKPGCVCK